jgi:hypothetical protein
LKATKVLDNTKVPAIEPGSSLKAFMDEFVFSKRKNKDLPDSLQHAINSVRGIARTDHAALMRVLKDESSDYADGKAAAIVKICAVRPDVPKIQPKSQRLLELVPQSLRRGISETCRRAASFIAI